MNKCSSCGYATSYNVIPPVKCAGFRMAKVGDTIRVVSKNKSDKSFLGRNLMLSGIHLPFLVVSEGQSNYCINIKRFQVYDLKDNLLIFNAEDALNPSLFDDLEVGDVVTVLDTPFSKNGDMSYLGALFWVGEMTNSHIILIPKDLIMRHDGPCFVAMIKFSKDKCILSKLSGDALKTLDVHGARYESIRRKLLNLYPHFPSMCSTCRATLMSKLRVYEV